MSLIPADGKSHQYVSNNSFDAKVILYKPEAGGKLHALNVIASHDSGRTYAIAGGQQFYTEDADGLWGFLLDGDTLTVRRSLLRVSGADEESLKNAIHELARKTKDAELGSDAGKYAELDTKDVMRSGQGGGGLIEGVSVERGRATIYSYGLGLFAVDWKAKKLIYPVAR